MENFNNFYGEANLNLIISKGTIFARDNEVSNDYDLFYWCYFLPSLTDDTITIIGECGFDIQFEKTDFKFTYNSKTDIVYYYDVYRTVKVEKETYNKYKDYLQTGEPLSDEGLPWIRFPRTKDGIIIPLLVEKIFNKIPTKIVFIK